MQRTRINLDAFVEGWDYPVVIVTAAVDDGRTRAGCLVGFTTQCSIDPGRLLVCLSTSNHTYRVARRAPVLAVHCLAADQRDLAALFGGQTGDEVDKFARCAWRRGREGVPVLAECPRWFVGEVGGRLALGDHVGFVLEPVQVGAARNVPLMGYSQVRDLEAGQPA